MPSTPVATAAPNIAASGSPPSFRTRPSIRSRGIAATIGITYPPRWSSNADCVTHSSNSARSNDARSVSVNFTTREGQSRSAPPHPHWPFWPLERIHEVVLSSSSMMIPCSVLA